MVKCPVCSTALGEKKVAAASRYKGETYYFCANTCKLIFDKEPEKYVRHEKAHS